MSLQFAMSNVSRLPVSSSYSSRVSYVPTGDSNTPRCSACLDIGADCIRELNVKFKNGLEHTEDAVFPTRQRWVTTPKHVHYIDETTKICQHYTDTSSQNDSGVEYFSNTSTLPQITQSRSNTDGVIDNRTASVCNIRVEQQTNEVNEVVDGQSHSPTPPTPVPITGHEAVLMKHFIEEMALWADITDPCRHFELQVPCRALYQPVLRYAVLAFSSLHLYRNTPHANVEALEHYNECVRLLIQSISEQDQVISEELLAAISILRQYEEVEEGAGTVDDRELHLHGTTRIVNAMSRVDFNGGLGEAAAWLCLREDICVSIVKQKPLQMNLDTFLQSDVFRRSGDDAAYANRIIFLVARALTCAFSAPSSPSVRTLGDVRRDVEEWYRRKPLTFVPIKDQASGDKSKPLPEIWTLNPFHTIGLQHYYIAQIIFAVSSTQPASILDRVRHGRSIQSSVRANLLRIMGIAMSNRKAENVLFTARHSLVAWGSLLEIASEQQAAEDFLAHVQDRTGWSTESMRSTLREQWSHAAIH